MRVVIIGLLPAQAQIIKQEFRGLDLRIIHKDTRESAYAVAEAAKRADRVLLMTRFVGHKIIERLDKRNVTSINGAMTALREALKMLDATAHVEPAPLPAPRLVPSPQLPPDKEPIVAQKQNDFSALKDAKPGDVLEFRRPGNVSKDAFEKQVSGARSHYKRVHGVHTSMDWDGDGHRIHVMVERIDEKPVGKENETTVAAPATSAVDTLPPAQPAPRLGEFWQAVYLQSMRNNPGAQPHAHEEAASLAIAAWFKQFGSTP